MHLNEQILTEWTGLKGRELCIFYLMYKKQASNMFNNDLNSIKQDIIKFKDNIFKNKDIKQEKDSYKKNITNMIEFWESNINKEL
jgi:hypothetical protein